MRRMWSKTAARICVILFLAAAVTHGGELELRGRVLAPDGKPLPGRRAIQVTLNSASTPYTAQELTLGGRFRFKRLAAGTYTVSAAVRGLGEVRQSVDVTPSLADRKGRIHVELTLRTPQQRAGAGHTVSTRQLSVPYRAWEHYQRAHNDLKKRKVEEAVERLEGLVEKTPQFVEALNLLGTIYYHKREFDRAEDYFRQALEHDGNAFEPLVNLGGTLLSMNRVNEALPFNENAALAKPDDALANSQLGMNYYYLGDLESALEHLTKAKQLDPAHFSHPQMILAEIYLRQGDRLAAADELEEFVRLHPDHPESGKIRSRVPVLRKAVDAQRVGAPE